MASPSGGKLWDKSEPLDALIERFTVGDDYQLDSALVAADCVASLAHATMLAAIAVIAPGDLEQLRSGLLAALQQAEEGLFVIERADEDGHTALERFLTRHTAAGARIHTGRSRNDQVMAALRLYGRDALVALQRLVLDLADALLGFAAAHERRSMPGRTHTQIAMPSTLGLWAAAFAEELLDDLALLETCYRLTNRSPLGSAAGYGAPLPLDREQVAALLGCDGPVHNVLAAANSRGKLEAITLDALDQVAMTLSRLAQDLMLFSLPELGYVTLPVELCTGSSIMPHKRNPDGLELVRARAATVSGLAGGVKGIVRTLPSGYHRDLQETKRPYLQGFEIVAGQLSVMLLTVERLQVHDDALTRALTPELFATDTAFALVRGGMAFRDAYRAASGIGARWCGAVWRFGTRRIAPRTATGTEGGAMERADLGAEAEAEAALARRTATGMEGGAMERRSGCGGGGGVGARWGETIWVRRRRRRWRGALPPVWKAVRWSEPIWVRRQRRRWRGALPPGPPAISICAVAGAGPRPSGAAWTARRRAPARHWPVWLGAPYRCAAARGCTGRPPAHERRARRTASGGVSRWPAGGRGRRRRAV